MNFVRKVDVISITVFGENKVAAIKSMLTIEELITFDKEMYVILLIFEKYHDSYRIMGSLRSSIFIH